MYRKNIFFLLKKPAVQCLILIAIVIITFWHMLWGNVPRYDQELYLHAMSQYTGFFDIIANSISFNRSVYEDTSVNSLLFRPALYLQLGTFLYLFGHNFFLWQFASLVLHIATVLALYAVFMQGRLQHTTYPLLISALFGCSFVAAELVLWHHISGYSTFCLLTTLSVLFLIKFFTRRNSIYGVLALFSAMLAQFMYELGVIFNLMLVTVFLYMFFFEKDYISNQSKHFLVWPVLFFCSAALYPVLSVTDFLLRDVSVVTNSFNVTAEGQANFSPSQSKTSLIEKIVLGNWNAIQQIPFWLGGLMVPAIYEFEAYHRTLFSGFRISGWLVVVNAITILIMLFLFFPMLKKYRSCFAKDQVSQWLLVFSGFLLLYTYLFIISAGRTYGAGIPYIFVNTHYAYIPQLIFLITMSFLFIKKTEHVKSPCCENHAATWKILLSVLVMLNGYHTYQVAKSYHYDYSLSKIAVFEAVESWAQDNKQKPDMYFKVSEDCVANHEIHWFSPGYFRRYSGWQSGPVTVADALWSKKSFILNEGYLTGTDYVLSEIPCPQEAILSEEQKSRDKALHKTLWELIVGKDFVE